MITKPPETLENRLSRIYEAVLSPGWGKGAPYPLWREIWDEIVKPKLPNCQAASDQSALTTQ